jgi:hypothetical protein
MAQDTVPMQALVSRDEIGNGPFAADFLIVWVDDDRRNADASSSPLVGTWEKRKDLVANKAILAIRGIAGLNGAFRKQRDRPTLIALPSIRDGFVEQRAQPSIKNIVADQHHGVSQLRSDWTLRLAKLR